MSREKMCEINTMLGNTMLEEIKAFSNLGHTMTYKNNYLTGVKRRVALTQAYKNMNSLSNKHLSIETRKQFAKMFKWSY